MSPTPEHERLRRLVLAWEDLDDAERAEATEHLAACPRCRELREAFERHERAPGPLGAMPPEALDHPPALGPQERREAEASRHALLVRLGVDGRVAAEEQARDVRPLRRPWSARLAWLVPAAAAAAVLVWFARPRPAVDFAIDELSAVHVGVVRGEGPATVFPDSVWRTGDVFELRVRLSRAGWPAIVHVGPDGVPSLLRPGASDTTRVPSGLQRLGPADPAEEWVLQDPPGPEDLLVAVRTRSPVDREALTRELAALAAGPGRDQRLEASRRVLERHAGPVRRITLRRR